MTNLSAIKKWKYHYFESASYRTEDYAKFEGTLKRWYKRMCKNNGWELAEARTMHFECSIVIKGKNGRFVNVLGSDVRFPAPGRSWYDAVCYRYCAGPKDCRGENNRWTNFDELEERLQTMLNN